MNYAECGEYQNERIKFDTLVIADIAKLKRTHKQVEIRYNVIYKTTCLRSKRILAVSPRFSTQNAMNLPFFRQICFHHKLYYAVMDHNGFERQTQHFPGTISWTNLA